MGFTDVDARIVTAVSLWVIGATVTGFALRVWWTQPVNRAFLFGPYLTEDGLRLILRVWPMLYLLGVTALAGGFARFAYWTGLEPKDGFAALVGAFEALVTTVAAVAVVSCFLWHLIHRRRGE